MLYFWKMHRKVGNVLRLYWPEISRELRMHNWQVADCDAGVLIYGNDNHVNRTWRFAEMVLYRGNMSPVSEAIEVLDRWFPDGWSEDYI